VDGQLLEFLPMPMAALTLRMRSSSNAQTIMERQAVEQ
jgi:hypothetical protein